MSHSWQCPFCNNHAIVNENNISTDSFEFDNNNKLGRLCLKSESITCPNPNCKEFTLKVTLLEMYPIQGSNLSYTGDIIQEWSLRPQSSAKPLPNYIPKAIKEDYAEACLILNLSPKASATLARRCLQGMLRDFWKVKPNNLAREIESIEDKVSPEVWSSIDVIRQIGNIGAHMEKDINQIIEVDENEAGLLIGLIEMLIDEWYVNRHNRQQRLAEITKLGQSKSEEKQKLKNESSS